MNSIYIFSFAQKPFWTLVNRNFRPFDVQWNTYKTDLLPQTGTFREMAHLYQQNPEEYLGIALAWEPFVGSLPVQADGQKTRNYSQNVQDLLDNFVHITRDGPNPDLPKAYKIDLDSPICSLGGKEGFYSEAIIESHYSGETLLIFRGTPWADPHHPDSELIQEKHNKLLNKMAEATKAFDFTQVYYDGNIDSMGKDVDYDQARWKLLVELAKWTRFEVSATVELFQGSALHHPAWEIVGEDGLNRIQRTVHQVLKTRPIFHKQEIEGYLKFHYQFRFNLVTGKPEIKQDEAFEEITDFIFNSIYRAVTNSGGNANSNHLRQLLTSDMVTPYHPFLDYFKGLPAWDSEQDPDYICQLADAVVTTDPDYWHWTLKKWLVGAVATAVHPNKTNQQVLVLCGPQGCGKSTYLERLLPKKLEGYLFSGQIDPSSKDSLAHLAENFLVNLDEMDSMNRGKEAALKELISKPSIKYRRPYGVFNQSYKRVASFMGSVNHEGILSDSSGSRRYLVHKVLSIDYQHSIDMDLVWAQAYALYKQGYEFWFAGKDIKRIQKQNEVYQLGSVEEEMLLQAFSPASPNDAMCQKLTATEILKRLNGEKLPPNHASAVIKLGQALLKHGYSFVMIKGSKRWFVKPDYQLNDSNPDLWGG